jgi:uncharacterized protein (TIGR00725 family)
MNDTSESLEMFHLDRAAGVLCDALGRRFDPALRRWEAPLVREDSAPLSGHAVDPIEAATWVQRESGHKVRVPVGVIGPRDATLPQLAAAERIGAGLADIGIAVLCGGRHGVMQAVCEGVRRGGGITIGLLPDATPDLANPYLSLVLATGLGEARNAVIARAAFCLVAIGDSLGTLSEVALGLQFGKRVIGLEGAAQVDGVRHFASAADALRAVALQIVEHGS